LQTQLIDPRILVTAERLLKRFRSNLGLFPSEKEKVAWAKFEKAVTQISVEIRKLIAASEASFHPPTAP